MTEYYSFYQGLPQNVCLDTAFGMLRINNLNLHGQSKQAHTHTHGCALQSWKCGARPNYKRTSSKTDTTRIEPTSN